MNAKEEQRKIDISQICNIFQDCTIIKMMVDDTLFVRPIMLNRSLIRYMRSLRSQAHYISL